jgi:NTP pyrophosphatase (non-canonical NTP hydrolase)
MNCKEKDEALRRYTLRHDVLRRINMQIGHNLAKWGEDTDGITLVAVMTEEAGEVARAVLEFNHRALSVGQLRSLEMAKQIAREAIQLAAVCVEIARVAEDEACELRDSMALGGKPE